MQGKSKSVSPHIQSDKDNIKGYDNTTPIGSDFAIEPTSKNLSEVDFTLPDEGEEMSVSLSKMLRQKQKILQPILFNSKNKSFVKEIYDKIRKFDSAKTIEDKLDIAYEIYLKCLVDDEVLKEDLIKYKGYAMQFMKMVLNIEGDEKVIELLKQRNEMKKYNPAYLPRESEIFGVGNAKSKAQYNLQRLVKLGVALKQKDIMRVTDSRRSFDEDLFINMYDHQGRADYRVILSKGLFYKPLLDKKFGESMFELYDTKCMTSHGKPGYAAYVINAYGEISIFSHFFSEDGNVHSSMNAGASVFGVGEIKITNGRLVGLTNYSGHYMPKINNVYNILRYFQLEGVDLANVNVLFIERPEEVDYLEVNIDKENMYSVKAKFVLEWGGWTEQLDNQIKEDEIYARLIERRLKQGRVSDVVEKRLSNVIRKEVKDVDSKQSSEEDFYGEKKARFDKE